MEPHCQSALTNPPTGRSTLGVSDIFLCDPWIIFYHHCCIGTLTQSMFSVVKKNYVGGTLFLDSMAWRNNIFRYPRYQSVIINTPTWISTLGVSESLLGDAWIIFSSSLVDCNPDTIFVFSFQDKFLLVAYCSWVVWITGIISPGSQIVIVWQPIHLMGDQPWGSLKFHWVILEIFFNCHWFIETLKTQCWTLGVQEFPIRDPCPIFTVHRLIFITIIVNLFPCSVSIYIYIYLKTYLIQKKVHMREINIKE